MSEIMSAGEKIKKLRTDLGLKQEDLTDDSVSKSLISMIEQGKRGLTLKTAEIIAACLNKYYEKTDITITAEWLVETERDQARKEILKNLDHLQRAINSRRADEQLVMNTFDMVMELTKKWDFEEEFMELKILRGDFYYDNHQYKEALCDYLEVLNYSIKKQDYAQIANIYIHLGSTYQMLMVFDSAIAHYVNGYNMAMTYNTKNKDKIKAQSMFNQIVCYKIIKRFDLTLTHIGLFRDITWDDPLFKIYNRQVTLIEANTYRDLENWKKAQGIYEELLTEAKRLDAETLFLLYENYGLFYRNKGYKTKALEYFEKAFNLKDDVSYNYLPALYLYQSTCYNLEEEYEKMASFLEKGLKLADMISAKHEMIKVRFSYVEVFLKLKDYETALQQLRSIDNLVREVVAKPLLHDLYSYYIQVYNGLGDLTKSTEYAIKIRQENNFKLNHISQ